jgi:hypothetical protein
VQISRDKTSESVGHRLLLGINSTLHTSMTIH